MIELLLRFLKAIKINASFVKPTSFTSDILFNDFLSVPITKKLAKYKKITPNIVTYFAIVVSLIAIYFYFIGGKINLMIGAFIFYLSTILDGIDGKLARKNNVMSEFGAKLDRYSDSAKKALAIAALIYSSSEMPKPTLLLLVIFHYVLLRVKYRRNMEHILKCKRYGVKSLFEPVDGLFLLLVIGPLFNQFYALLVFIIVLQLAKIAFHFTLNFLNNQ